MELNNPVTKELRENFKGAVNRNFSALTDPNEIKGKGKALDLANRTVPLQHISFECQ